MKGKGMEGTLWTGSCGFL